MPVGTGGTVASYETTVLLTPDEAVDAMRKATDSSYRPAAG